MLNEIIAEENDHRSDSESDCDQDLDYLSHGLIDDKTVNSLAFDVIKDLFITKKLNRCQYIQRSSIDENDVKVEHIVLIDDNLDDQINEFSDSNNNYTFQSKLKVLQDLQLNYRRKSIYGKNNQKKLTKSDVQINAIPNSFEEFLRTIFDLNPLLIEDKDSKLYFIDEAYHKTVHYKDHESYVNALIPLVLRELWNSLKKSRKLELSTELMSYEIIEENKVKCSYIRNKNANECKFKFGQMLILSQLIDTNPTSVSPKVVFGIIQGIESKLIDKTSHHLSSFNLSEFEPQETDFIFDEITVRCNTFASNCDKVSVMTLRCVQNYLLETRAVYELKNKFPKVFEQVLEPIFEFAVTGISINMDDRKSINFFEDQLDSIQKAYEVSIAPDIVPSSFVAIYGPKKSGKTEVLRETILQLLKYGQTKIDKLLVISESISEITSIVEQLKRHGIKVYHIDSEGNCVSHNKQEFRNKIIKLNEQLLFHNIVGQDNHSYEQCLKFYKEEIQMTDMSTKDKFIKEKIEKLVVSRLLAKSQVIIGSISSICNDEAFNVTYNFVEENAIKSVLIDNASFYTEPEILSLLYAGVKGIVLFGDTHINPKSYEKCESFLQRYIRLYNSTNSNQMRPQSTSVVKLRDSIESRKRYEESLRYRDHRTIANDHFGRNKSYSFHSNSEKSHFRYFNANRLHKHPLNKNKNFKSYYMNNKKPSLNKYSGRNLKPRFSHPNIDVNSRPDSNPFDSSQYDSNGSEYDSNNMLVDSVQSASHFAYGNRDSYLRQTSNQTNDYDYNESSYNMMSAQTYGNIAPQYVTQTNSQFMGNPPLNVNQSYHSR